MVECVLGKDEVVGSNPTGGFMKKIRSIKIKAIISLLLIITFAVALFTGIGLYGSSNETNAEIDRLSPDSTKTNLKRIHTISSFAMAGLALIHLLLNRRMLSAEIKALLGN